MFIVQVGYCMKVLYIVGGSGKRYGSEIIAMSILKELFLSKHVEYTVITSKNGCVNELCRELDIENYVLSMRFYVYCKGRNNLIGEGKRIIRECQADYVATKALKQLEQLVQLESYDLVHTNLSRDLLGGMIKEKYNIPHVWHLQELLSGHYGLELLKRNQISWMNKRADAYIAISNHVADDWKHHGLDENKVKVIINGIDYDYIEEKDWEIQNNCLRIVMVGEICEAKGQIFLLEAVNRILKNNLKDFNILVDFYGEGRKDYMNVFRNKIEIYQLQNVVSLKGYCRNIRSILKDYEIAVNCSRGEGFGLSTIEFMSSGLCVIAADTGANTEIIENKVNGIIFRYENAIDELYAIILSLVKSKSTMVKLGKRARNDVKSKYALQDMCNCVYEVYNEIMILK